MPVLPIIADAGSYRPCIQDLLADGEEVRNYWLDLFVAHIGTLAELPVDGDRLAGRPEWEAFRQDYLAGLAELRRDPARRGRLTVLELTQYREERFAAHGIVDPFADLKRRENDLALRMLPDVLRDIDATPPARRDERLVRGLFAGNLFDMGSKAAVDAFTESPAQERPTLAGAYTSQPAASFDFVATRDKVRPRPWPIDQLDDWLDHWASHCLRVEQTHGAHCSTPDAQHSFPRGVPPYRQALFFVDNAGPDIILGVIPFVRHLAGMGTSVVLAANSKPALNDVTAAELRSILDACRRLDIALAALLRDGRISVVESGCTAPLIDLADVTPQCCAAAADSDLLILEGMGRAIESNYDACFTIDTIKIALIKDAMVARILGVELFDPVFRFDQHDSPCGKPGAANLRQDA
ncbi:MAG: DUF89 family protein [Phycisphaerae bacterium]|nr:DUF89 family protein [Phycisphaerae bacterium]